MPVLQIVLGFEYVPIGFSKTGYPEKVHPVFGYAKESPDTAHVCRKYRIKSQYVFAPHAS
jgi:hypothetical protein